MLKFTKNIPSHRSISENLTSVSCGHRLGSERNRQSERYCRAMARSRKRPRSLPRVTLKQLGLSDLETTAAELAPLTLRQYVDFLAQTPLPTEQQKQNFIEYVSHAHSWYKHLPLYPPGAPFYFFIDKYAACDRLVSRDGTAVIKERIESGFRYSDSPHCKISRSLWSSRLQLWLRNEGDCTK
jgi:hypothetical protein